MENGVATGEEDLRCVNTRDEDKIFLKLWGRKETLKVEMLAWGTDTFVGLPDLRRDLKINPYDFSSDRSFTDVPVAPSAAIEARSHARSLIELANLIHIDKKERLPFSVEVVVIARKAVKLVIKDGGQVIIIGHSLICDETGYCTLLTFNDAVVSVHSQIQVDDRILITKANFCSRHSSNFGSIFLPHLFLDLEIQPNGLDARKIYKMKDNLRINYPPGFFNDSRTKLWSPFEVLNHQTLFQEAESQRKAVIDQDNEPFIVNVNVVGLIKHVGRLERKAVTEPKPILKRLNSNSGVWEDFEYQKYRVYRWIEIIDISQPNSTPLPVLVFVRDIETWPVQTELIPGSLLMITHCLMHEDYCGKYIATSQYSQLLRGNEMTNYVQKMPSDRLDSLAPYKNLNQWTRIMEKIKWTIGGGYPRRISSKQLLASYEGRANGFIDALPFPRLPFVRRETQRIDFIGKICSIHHATFDRISENKIRLKTVFTNPEIAQRCSQLNGDSKKLGCWYSIAEFSKYYWSSRSYTLPLVQIDQFANGAKIATKIEIEYSKYVDMFAMPSKPVDYKLLSELTVTKLSAFFCVDLLNETNDWVYHCIFWSKSYQEMEKQLKDAKKKQVKCIVDIHAVEKDPVSNEMHYEVILQDFIMWKKSQIQIPIMIPQ